MKEGIGSRGQTAHISLMYLLVYSAAIGLKHRWSRMELYAKSVRKW